MRDSFEFDCVYGSQCTKDIYPIYSLEELVAFIDDDEDDSNEEEGEDDVMAEEECNYFSGLLYGVDNNQ